MKETYCRTICRDKDHHGYVISFKNGDGPSAIKCLCCGVTSYHPEDVRYRYCSVCKIFHDIMLEHIGSISALLKASLKWPIPSAITIMKEPYIILDVNPAWEEASGWKREEVVGRSLDDLHLWVHPEDRPIMLRHLQEEGPQLAFVEFRMKDGSVKSFVGTLVETSAGDVKGTAIEDGRLKAA